MTTAAPASNAAGASDRLRFVWMFSRRADLAMLALPILVTGVAFFSTLRGDLPQQDTARLHAGWITAFLLGNTSHVLLTFLLLGARRDMLHATPTQARNVALASSIVFVVAMALMRLTQDDVWTRPFYETVTVIFATHHTISQVKGFWSLYGLRGGQAGLPPPSSREREVQKLFVPLSLLFIAIRWTLVAKIPEQGVGPFQNVNPGDPAILPYEVTYGLLALWAGFSVVLLRSLFAYDTVNLSKVVYLGTHCAVVGIMIFAPAWGLLLSAGIHGLEYYFLTRRMLAPLPEEKSSRLTTALCWPAMIAAMSPILFVGALRNPFGLSFLEGQAWRTWALMAVNACVLAHYAADAFIYRFRIPGIRKVAMARLGF